MGRKILPALLAVLVLAAALPVRAESPGPASWAFVQQDDDATGMTMWVAKAADPMKRHGLAVVNVNGRPDLYVNFYAAHGIEPREITFEVEGKGAFAFGFDPALPAYLRRCVLLQDGRTALVTGADKFPLIRAMQMGKKVMIRYVSPLDGPSVTEVTLDGSLDAIRQVLGKAGWQDFLKKLR